MDIAALAIPSREVGGDYFDLVTQQNGSLLLAIADVTGKGVPASLLMANLQACLHTMVPMDLTMEEFIGHMNRVICNNTSYDKFITAFTGLYLPKDRRFEYVNAGHNPPMLLRASGDLELLEKGGLLLGVMKDAPYERGSVHLAPGDMLVAFTDGVTEAMSPDGEEFHEDRLEAILRAHQQGTAQDILGAVRQAIIDFTGSETRLSDDLTMIVIKAV
jgi:sigma-B regulation protein RsbU (phosphoserine phosphatase)